MRIAQVLPYAEFGGTEKHCLSLCRELASRHEVCLVSPFGPALGELDPRVAHHAYPRLDHDLRRGVSELVRVLRGLDVDLVHVHGGVELVWLARLASRRRPLVYTVHGFAGSAGPSSYRLARWTMRLADRTICVSRAELARLPGAQLIYSGLPDPGVTPPPGRGLIGFVGRLDRNKGAEVLLRSGVRPLLIVGDGDLREELTALARRQGGEVTFTGFRADAPALIAACDLIAVPSLQEGFGLVALEAAAAGRPVVASGTGGLPEVVVDGETGLLVPPGDPEALGAALRRLQTNPALAQTLGDAARRRFLADFTLDRMTAATEEVYRRLCQDSPPPSQS